MRPGIGFFKLIIFLRPFNPILGSNPIKSLERFAGVTS